MILSKRLKHIAMMVDRCEKIADIGTDHGYIPIFLIENSVCKTAIAGDISKGSLEKAKLNIIRHNLQGKIECRLGKGLTVINPYEVQGTVIAGMGGNLIKDILEDSLEVVKDLNFIILQPVQNSEILREYIYTNGIRIIEEDLCYEDGKFYEIIKIAYDTNPLKADSIFYEIPKNLLDKGHPLLKDFINFKIDKYNKIMEHINEDTLNADRKKKLTIDKIYKLKELLRLCH